MASAPTATRKKPTVRKKTTRRKPLTDDAKRATARVIADTLDELDDLFAALLKETKTAGVHGARLTSFGVNLGSVLQAVRSQTKSAHQIASKAVSDMLLPSKKVTMGTVQDALKPYLTSAQSDQLRKSSFVDFSSQGERFQLYANGRLRHHRNYKTGRRWVNLCVHPDSGGSGVGGTVAKFLWCMADPKMIIKKAHIEGY